MRVGHRCENQNSEANASIEVVWKCRLSSILDGGLQRISLGPSADALHYTKHEVDVERI